VRRLRPRDELRGDSRVRRLTVWTPGQTIVIQEVWKGMLWAARPVILVEDRGSFLAAWCPKGTRRKVPTTPPWRPRERTRGERLATSLELRDWVLIDHEWDVSTLMLTEEGAMHSVWVSWLDNGEHWGWYVNLQLPMRRAQDVVQTMDLALDVIIAPDKSSWTWKDEDEFQVAIDRNLIDEETASAVRAEAAEVIRRAQANEPPFCDPWPEWLPDPSWGLPHLPDGWDRVTKRKQ
jgi:predicted RNA-binding protein associated with RNAse of E/G family